MYLDTFFVGQLTVVIVNMSWHNPPLASVVREGPLVVNRSKSSLKSHTAWKTQNTKYEIVCFLNIENCILQLSHFPIVKEQAEVEVRAEG